MTAGTKHQKLREIADSFRAMGVDVTFKDTESGKVDLEVSVRDDASDHVKAVIAEHFSAEGIAEGLGGKVLHQADGRALVGIPEEMKDPVARAAKERMVAGLEVVRNFIADNKVPAELGLALKDVLEGFDHLLRARRDESAKVAAQVMGLFDKFRSFESSQKGKQRVKVNANARAKAEAKKGAEALFNKWMDTKPKKSWTNEQFAIEVLREWKGKIASIGVVVGWIPEWKRERKARGAVDA